MHIIVLRVLQLETTQNIVFYEPNKHTWHAEQKCIQKCKNKARLKKCTMIIIKIDKNDTMISGLPCRMCRSIIDKYKIKNIITFGEKIE